MLGLSFEASAGIHDRVKLSYYVAGEDEEEEEVEEVEVMTCPHATTIYASLKCFVGTKLFCAWCGCCEWWTWGKGE